MKIQVHLYKLLLPEQADIARNYYLATLNRAETGYRSGNPVPRGILERPAGALFPWSLLNPEHYRAMQEYAARVMGMADHLAPSLEIKIVKRGAGWPAQ